jgi:hypothetical protein
MTCRCRDRMMMPFVRYDLIVEQRRSDDPADGKLLLQAPADEILDSAHITCCQPGYVSSLRDHVVGRQNMTARQRPADRHYGIGHCDLDRHIDFPGSCAVAAPPFALDMKTHWLGAMCVTIGQGKDPQRNARHVISVKREPDSNSYVFT